MIPKSFASTGIVLKRNNINEYDKIITLLTKDYGKISLIAKGVKKVTSRKRGSLEVFSLIKFHAVATKGIDILTEVELLDGFKEIRLSLKKILLGYYFCETVLKLTHENDVNPEIFLILKKYLSRLKIEQRLKILRFNFVEDLMISAGYYPSDEKIINHDDFLNNVIEKKIYSQSLGKRILNKG